MSFVCHQVIKWGGHRVLGDLLKPSIPRGRPLVQGLLPVTHTHIYKKGLYGANINPMDNIKVFE